MVNGFFLLNVPLALKCGELSQVSFFTCVFFLPILLETLPAPGALCVC